MTKTRRLEFPEILVLKEKIRRALKATCNWIEEYGYRNFQRLNAISEDIKPFELDDLDWVIQFPTFTIIFT
jgi:hypothetical protein